VVWAAAAALAVSMLEPIPARLPATVPSTSGTVIMNDIADLSGGINSIFAVTAHA